MRKSAAILGILLTVIILISGSAVAPWVDHVEYYEDCTNPNGAVGSPNYDDATVGENPSTLGVLLLDLDAGNEMGANQLFTVYGYSGINNINETYNIIIYNNDYSASYGPYNGWDSADLDFRTPMSPPNPQWRYFEITGTSGLTSDMNEDDTIYGPEIDAVGW